VVLLALLSCTGVRTASAQERVSAIAVFPVENLSGDNVPADEIRAFLIERLVAEGFRVLTVEALDGFMTRHRIRYAAGIDAATADALRQETGVDGVVFTSVELSSGAVPPKVAIMARLVSIKAAPAVVWADDVGKAGDDAPGLLALGIVNDYQTLQARALDHLARSLLTYLATGTSTASQPASKFRPKTFYRGRAVVPGQTYSIAVLPFVNLTDRRGAGEILAWLFIRHLASVPQFRVIDSGVARQELLNARIIMDGGVSISDADTLATLIEADFILGGRVLSYQDYEGSGAPPRVEFSTVLIEKTTRRVVWSSDSYNQGDDGVRFFGRGRTRTAHAMATQMVGLATEMIAGDGK
jgi:TolB-like protein